MTTYRLYVIGYDPSGYPDEAFVRREIQLCDTCVLSDRPIPIGASFRVALHLSGPNDTGPDVGQVVRVTGHEHGGKILIAELVPAN